MDPAANEWGSTEPALTGRAEARRVRSAGLADLAERQADAVAALDRALEARLGEFDRAFGTRQNQLEGRLSDAESALAEAIDNGIAEFRRAVSDERRLLQEQAAAQLAELEQVVADGVREIEHAVDAQRALLDHVLQRVDALERGERRRIHDLG